MGQDFGSNPTFLGPTRFRDLGERVLGNFLDRYFKRKLRAGISTFGTVHSWVLVHSQNTGKVEFETYGGILGQSRNDIIQQIVNDKTKSRKKMLSGTLHCPFYNVNV